LHPTVHLPHSIELNHGPDNNSLSEFLVVSHLTQYCAHTPHHGLQSPWWHCSHSLSLSITHHFSHFLKFIFIAVLGGGTLWHLQKILQYIKYFILEFTLSTILLYSPTAPIPGIV
jgi:hypothetical protein